MTLAPSASPPAAGRALWVAAAAVAPPFVLWQAALRALAAPEMAAKGPLDVLRYHAAGPGAEAARGRQLAALVETLPITLAGLAAALAVALALAALGKLRPGLARTLMPVALVSQTMPLAALTPLLVLLLGRGLCSA